MAFNGCASGWFILTQRTQNLEFVNLKCVTYAWSIPLPLNSLYSKRNYYKFVLTKRNFRCKYCNSECQHLIHSHAWNSGRNSHNTVSLTDLKIFFFFFQSSQICLRSMGNQHSYEKKNLLVNQFTFNYHLHNSCCTPEGPDMWSCSCAPTILNVFISKAGFEIRIPEPEATLFHLW